MIGNIILGILGGWAMLVTVILVGVIFMIFMNQSRNGE